MNKVINSNYVLVSKLPRETQEGFATIEVQDDFVYRGKIVQLPGPACFVSNHELAMDDIVIFAKYSPDSHQIEENKFVKVTDILAVL